MTKRNGPRKGVYKSYAGIPRIVCDNPDYIGLSGNAAKLLFELARQFKGKNNGDLQAAFSLMQKRGYKSKDTLNKNIKELLAANLIIKTRHGKFINPGGVCALYALTWEPIDECQGKNLEVGPTRNAPRVFSLEKNQS